MQGYKRVRGIYLICNRRVFVPGIVYIARKRIEFVHGRDRYISLTVYNPRIVNVEAVGERKHRNSRLSDLYILEDKTKKRSKRHTMFTASQKTHPNIITGRRVAKASFASFVRLSACRIRSSFPNC